MDLLIPNHSQFGQILDKLRIEKFSLDSLFPDELCAFFQSHVFGRMARVVFYLIPAIELVAPALGLVLVFKINAKKILNSTAICRYASKYWSYIQARAVVVEFVPYTMVVLNINLVNSG